MRDALTLDQTLQRDACRFDFYQALRLIDAAHRDKPRLGAALSARAEAVRLGQDAELIFHPGALAGYVPGEEGRPGRLAVNFLGLLGPNGPLPTHLTAYVRERERHANDRTLARFLDLFHHRMLSLFYRAWAAAQPVVSAERPEQDRFAAYVGSLFGLGAPAMAQRDAIADHAKLHFAGVLAAPTRHADGLKLILAHFFNVDVEIEQWRGHWLTLPAESRTHLGGARLGMSTVVGTRVWDCQHAFRIVMGPLGYRDFQRFLPDGSSLRKLVDWVRNYLRDPLDWDVALELRRDEVPQLRLGGRVDHAAADHMSVSGPRLGWTTWLCSTTSMPHSPRVVIAPAAQASSNQESFNG